MEENEVVEENEVIEDKELRAAVSERMIFYYCIIFSAWKTQPAYKKMRVENGTTK